MPDASIHACMARPFSAVSKQKTRQYSSLPRLQLAESTQLQSVTIGSAFDRLYVAQQVVAHQRTLAIVDSSITRAQSVALRTMLQDQFRPALAAHLRTALELQAAVGKP